MGYVISNIIVIECIDKVLRLNHQILGRALISAVSVAFLALGIYDTNLGYHDGIFGTAIDYPDILCIFILVVGMELYGSDPEPDVTVITDFVQIPKTLVTNLTNDRL